MLATLVLLGSGALEAVWAVALSKSHGFTRLYPTIIFVVTLIASMGGLSYALRTLPLGTSYAIWVAVGAALTVTYSMATGMEPYSHLKVLLIAVVIGAVIGLKLLH